MLYTIQSNTLRFASIVCVLISCAIPEQFVMADESGARLVTTTMQDEQRRLPPDNSVLFSAATRSVALQLDVLSQLDSSELAGTMLAVINADGETQELTADAKGVVQITDVKAGSYAVVANNDEAHGTTMLVFEEESAEKNLFDAPEAIAPRQVGTARMSLVKIRSTELIPIIDKYLPASSDPDDRFVASDWTSKNGFGPSAFKVRVQDNNELFGQVISLLRTGVNSSNVEGTHVTLFNDGKKVGGAFADAAGRFAVPDVAPGFYGIVAAGPAGYGAFAFEVVDSMNVVQASNENAQHFVYALPKTAQNEFQTSSLSTQNVADVVPCVCIPPQYVPYAVETIRDYYPALPQDSALADLGGVSPVPGAGAGGSPAFGSSSLGPVGGGGFGAPVGGGFGGAGLGGGGFGGIGAIGLIGAAVAASSNNSDSNTFVPSLPVSPASPPRQ